MKSDTELDGLLGAYALDAIDYEERQEIDDYLARSPRARAEVFEHQQVAAALGNSTAEAPVALWQRIAESLDLDRAGLDGYSDETPALRMPFSNADSQETRDVPLRVVRGSDTRQAGGGTRGQSQLNAPGVASSTQRGYGRLIGVAAAACIAVLAVSALRLQQRVTSLRTQQSALATSRDAANKKLASQLRDATSQRDVLRKQVVDVAAKNQKIETQLVAMQKQDTRLQSILDKPDTQKVKLFASDGKQLADIVIGSDGVGYLIGGALPELTSGHTYQLWGVKDKEVLSLGVFGRSAKSTPFAANERWSKFVITDELSPGVASSKQPAFAVGDVESA
jgi:hypothetical protein